LSRQPRLNLSDYLPYLINRVGFALVERFSADALAERGLTIAMWRVLAALSHNGSQRQIDLSNLTTIEVSTLSRLVTRLVRDGLVSRTRNSANSREVAVELTAKGRTIVAQMIPVALGLEEIAARGLPKSDLAVVKRSLRRMHENLAGAQQQAEKDRGLRRPL
jgi:MarR family transcriptional regulator, organic hydroperoxide resistance regulator